MRPLAAALCLVYALSAAVQLNDPDPLRWIALYVAAALLAALYVTGRTARAACLTLALLAGGWAALLAPAALDAPLADFDEEQRELLGLLIVALGMLLLAWRPVAEPVR